MAEAIGLAASIVGLLGASFTVCNLCGEVKGAQEDIKQLVSEISSLSSLLEPLSTPAEASKISGSDSIPQLVQQCTEMLEKLQGELQQHQPDGQSDRTKRFRKFVGSSKSSLKWAFKKGGTLERIQKIERLKSAVTLQLQMWVIHILVLITQR